MKVDNAVILAAGMSSRFAPLSYETHKALIEVRGEILLERQISQLLSAGVPEIYIVTGHRAEQFAYLQSKFGVKLIYNAEHRMRNNHASIWAAREILNNSYVCSSDNYFVQNPFAVEAEEAYYAAEYAAGYTKEWCMSEDGDGYIASVRVGGENAWYMLGHAFWSEHFTKSFLAVLETEYELPETAGKLWESILIDHLDVLKMRIRKYPPGVIFEFDTLDELREFDASYRADTRSAPLKAAARELGLTEAEIVRVTPRAAVPCGFSFDCPLGHYECSCADGRLRMRRVQSGGERHG